jgi:hypothetical protein
VQVLFRELEGNLAVELLCKAHPYLVRASALVLEGQFLPLAATLRVFETSAATNVEAQLALAGCFLSMPDDKEQLTRRRGNPQDNHFQ